MSSAMLTRALGETGMSATAVGLGTWPIGGWMWGAPTRLNPWAQSRRPSMKGSP